MAVNENFLQETLFKLQGIDGLSHKRMFGGVGIFSNDLMFAKIGGEKLWFRVDAINQPEFEAAGMKAFHSEKKGKGMPYWEVPEKILEDKDAIIQWAKKALEAAIRNKK